LGFWAMAAEDPAHIAVVEPDGTKITSGELLARANRLVHGLRSLGIQPGDTVATVLGNGSEFYVSYLACLQAGWYLVPINNHLVGTEIAYILGNCEAKALIGQDLYAQACVAAADEASLDGDRRLAIGNVPGFRPLSELTDGQPDTTPLDRLAGAVMNYTSGTTGRPKGIRRKLPGVSPEDAGLGFGGILFLFGIQPRDGNVHLVGSPLYHTAVLVFSGAALHLGHSVVLMDKWSAQGMLERIEKYSVTHSHLVPTQFRRMLALPEAERRSYDLSSMRHMIHAAAPCPIDVKRQMIDWWGPVIDEYYAASEGGGTLVTSEEWLAKPGTVGKAWPISEVVVLDDDRRAVPPGVIGTVYMAAAISEFEYHKDPEKTAENRYDKYFTVGDLGYLDEDGYLFLADRKIDMIIWGGTNIYPAEIEGVLVSHPKIIDAAVFGIPDDEWGEVVKAVVEPDEDVQVDDELEAELLAFCRERLARFKVPASIEFVAELPRDPNGKLLKRKLRDPYWEGRQRRI
ncbi:MAG TPA: acyl-CoA synthetase, partial [Acidimicrobiales bacterium]|nr:acyl-CoA synthetase [Acidimicrobiales bacterium]